MKTFDSRCLAADVVTSTVVAGVLSGKEEWKFPMKNGGVGVPGVYVTSVCSRLNLEALQFQG